MPKVKPIKTPCAQLELQLIAELQPGKTKYFAGGWDKYFVQKLVNNTEISNAQREQLFRIAWKYRRQISIADDVLKELDRPRKDREASKQAMQEVDEIMKEAGL